MGGGDIGNERHVDVADVLGAGLLAVLTDGLDKRLGLDVTDRAAQLGDDYIGAGLLLNAAELVLNGIVTWGITCTVPPKKSPRRSRAIKLL